MSHLAPPLPPDPSPEPVFRLSVDQYHAMIDAGVLTEDDPVELLEGILVQKTPKNPKHRIALAKLQRALQPLLPQGMSFQMQDPITLRDSEPEPDGVVFRGLSEDYQDGHPGRRMFCLLLRSPTQRFVAIVGSNCEVTLTRESRCIGS